MVLFFTLGGCGRGAPASPRVSPDSVTGTAAVSGRVTISGPTPPTVIVTNQPCCPGAPTTKPDEATVVNPNGTLPFTVVYLDGGPRVDGTSLPPAVLDQKFCVYVPHVVGLVVHQKLVVRSSDPTTHNVAITADDGARNYYMTRPGDSAETRFAVAGFFGSKCDVHPTMKAVVAVMENRLFAVTGEDGTYRIENVPPGQYTLVARHERYGEVRRPVTVGTGPATADLDYHPPQP